MEGPALQPSPGRYQGDDVFGADAGLLSATVRRVRSLACWLLPVVVAATGCAHDRAADTLRLPPTDGRLFGFSSNAFQHTGRGPGALDLNVTAAREAADGRAAGAN